MLGEATEELLHEVLSTLAALVQADKGAAAAAEPGFSPQLLAVWEQHVTDPLVVMAALDLLSALAAIPACLANLQARRSSANAVACFYLGPLVNDSLIGMASLDLLMALATNLTCPAACRSVCCMASRLRQTAMPMPICRTPMNFSDAPSKWKLHQTSFPLPPTACPHHCAWTQERVLPPLAAILANPAGQPDMLVEGALDLLAALLKPSDAAGAARVYAAASGPVLSLLATSDDGGILQSACEYWRCAFHRSAVAIQEFSWHREQCSPARPVC